MKKYSDRLFLKVQAFEGLRLTSYKPVSTEKLWTIGFGHYGAPPKMTITNAEAEKLLIKDLDEAHAVVRSLVKVPLTQGQVDALTDFVFNLGAAKFRGSTLLMLVNQRADVARVQAEIKKWVHSDGKVLSGLVKRRAWEAQLWGE